MLAGKGEQKHLPGVVFGGPQIAILAGAVESAKLKDACIKPVCHGAPIEVDDWTVRPV